MKISEQEKYKTRLKLLRAASDVIIEKGYKSASMREIAQRAGVADATIYNYFPSKEKILYGYSEHKQNLVKQRLLEIENFNEFTVSEQLHELIEVELEVWKGDREFLQILMDIALFSPQSSLKGVKRSKKIFYEMAEDIIDAAIEAEEIPEQPYKDILLLLLWDYLGAIMVYWLKDDSENFEQTSHVVDKTIELIGWALQGAIVGKTLDLFSYLFRTHLLTRMDDFHTFMNPLKKSKRQFLRGED